MGGLLPTQAILVACEGIFAYHDTEDLLAFSVQIYYIILKIKRALPQDCIPMFSYPLMQLKPVNSILHA